MQPKKRNMGSLGLASYTQKKNQTKERELQIAKISKKLEKCFEFFVCTFVYS
jgi:hypothetical protein